MPDDASLSLEQSEKKHNEQWTYRWRTCTLWNGPPIGFELKAFDIKDGVTHEISKPMMYVIDFVQCVQHLVPYRNQNVQ